MAEEHSRIRFFPVSFFSIVMGLAGFAIAAQRAEEVFALPAGVGQGGAWFSALVFVLLAAAYGIKLLRFPEEVVKELNHPIKLSFFPTISIGLILLSVAFRAEIPILSFWLFALGAPLQLGFTLFVMSRWISHTHFEVHHSNPSWFIPVVGNILVPIAAINHGQSEIGWFFFSIGVVFWLVLLTIIINRVIFHNPLPAKAHAHVFYPDRAAGGGFHFLRQADWRAGWFRPGAVLYGAVYRAAAGGLAQKISRHQVFSFVVGLFISHGGFCHCLHADVPAHRIGLLRRTLSDHAGAACRNYCAAANADCRSNAALAIFALKTRLTKDS